MRIADMPFGHLEAGGGARNQAPVMGTGLTNRLLYGDVEVLVNRVGIYGQFVFYIGSVHTAPQA